MSKVQPTKDKTAEQEKIERLYLERYAGGHKKGCPKSIPQLAGGNVVGGARCECDRIQEQVSARA